MVSGGHMELDNLVGHSVKHNASDLHLCPGRPPIIRVDGLLRPLEAPTLTEGAIADCARRYLDARQRRLLARGGQGDAALTLGGGQRLRAHFFLQQGGLAVSLRIIPSRPPCMAELGLPAAAGELLSQPRGLVLVTGPAGSGKSSSLAAMVNHLNDSRALHIITLEDPIEHLHASRLCLIHQREIGRHCSGFRQGLRAALREDPDVILLGELRDCASIALALTAAETGHLLLCTLHARSASQAVDRLVDAFPANQQHFARMLLAGSLLGVMAQQLVRRPAGA
ncbi:type IV pilus twitching motility protein PilT [Candidatus Sodalis sp. SoCistrobi]|uniref:type IV pilus twitching motility protein PilT n=1 Tax=Candidatus Sodalis sp. SoCistrobi TaxID=1922216 RepID=UPI0015768336|nr:PilT/PilU family type 4a pilus ATPase [Candidatus Sodalis sp. SoCistrobi]